MLKLQTSWNSLVVQWLGLCTPTVKGIGSILSWGTKIPQAMEQLSPSIATNTQVSDSHSVMSNSL